MGGNSGQGRGDRAAGELSLSLPPRPEYLSVARLFAASIARHYGCTEETVEDVKVAISEAVTSAVQAHRSAAIDDPIAVTVATDEVVRFRIHYQTPGGPGERAGNAGELHEGHLWLELIRALFEDASLETTEKGAIVSFSVRAAPGTLRAS